MSGDFWGSQEGYQGPSRPSGRNRGLPLYSFEDGELSATRMVLPLLGPLGQQPAETKEVALPSGTREFSLELDLRLPVLWWQ